MSEYEGLIERLLGGPGDYTIGPLHREAAEALTQLLAERKVMRETLKAQLDRYVDLASSGDCGFWDCETEPTVIASRAVLASLRAEAEKA